MATYAAPGDQLVDNANFNLDIPLLNGSKVFAAQVGITRTNTPNIPVEIGVSNLSQQVNVYRLAHGNIWFGQFHNKVSWEGEKPIPPNEEYVARCSGRNDSGNPINILFVVVDDSG